MTDKFYTKPKVAEYCIQQTNRFHPLKSFDTIIEPAAGNGSFSVLLKTLFKNKVVAYDIDPEHKDVIQQDFLKLPQRVIDDYATKKVLVISNVPFGRQSTLARNFVKQSCKFANVVAFILPKSFKTPIRQKAFPLDWHLEHQEDIPDDSFTIQDREHPVPSVFQIWVKKAIHRHPVRYVEPRGFMYVRRHEPHDIIYRRVGLYAGQAVPYDPRLNRSVQSHFFIVIKEKNKIGKVIERLNTWPWKFGNHVGPRHIAKFELTPVLNKLLQDTN